MNQARLFGTLLGLTLASCAEGPNSSLGPNLGASGAGTAGSVYTMTNASAGNAVLAYDRQADGSLVSAGSFATGGTGSGGGLGNQGGVVLSPDGRWLLVVNAGSASLTAFRVGGPGGLQQTGLVATGGTMPVSVTIAGDLVYVLNAGGSGNIAGFRIGNDGTLTSIPGSTRALSAAGVGPAQVEFDPKGRVLVVTEKASNTITTYQVGPDGLASAPQAHPSNGATPFGFAFTQTGVLIVSEAFGGAADASAASSYAVDAAGGLQLISGSVPTTETAACWFVVTNSGRFAYTSNTGSGSISGYAVHQGALTLLDTDGQTGLTGPGSAPIDLALSRDSKFLYSLNSGAGSLSVFAVGADGSLESLGTVTGLPASANGLAAR